MEIYAKIHDFYVIFDEVFFYVACFVCGALALAFALPISIVLFDSFCKIRKRFF